MSRAAAMPCCVSQATLLDWGNQAIYQLRTYIDVFLVKETGLAKTILPKTGLGKTYWSRASDWLLWAITGLLRYLPRNDPHFREFQADLAVLAKGIAPAT